jgi:hypothetical protein
MEDLLEDEEEGKNEGLSLAHDIAGVSLDETNAAATEEDLTSEYDEGSCWSSVASTTAERKNDDTHQHTYAEVAGNLTNSAVVASISTIDDFTTATRVERRNHEDTLAVPKVDDSLMYTVDASGSSPSVLAPILYSSFQMHAVNCRVTTVPSTSFPRESTCPKDESERSARQDMARVDEMVNHSDSESSIIPSSSTVAARNIRTPPSSDNAPVTPAAVYTVADDEIMFQRHMTHTPPPPPPPPPPSNSSEHNHRYSLSNPGRKRGQKSIQFFGAAHASNDRSDSLLGHDDNMENSSDKVPRRSATIRRGGAHAVPIVVSSRAKRRKPAWWRGYRKARAGKSASAPGTAADVSGSGRSTVLLDCGYDSFDHHDGSDLATALPPPPSFSEEDWTPLDTSYGAAIPFGGFIPKTIRRLIEHCILVLFVLSLTGLVVVTSIKLRPAATGGGSGSSSTSPSYVTSLDDDFGSSNATNATWDWNATADYGSGDDARSRRRQY